MIVAPLASGFRDTAAAIALKSLPCWLISAVVHTLVMIALAAVLVPPLLCRPSQIEATFDDRPGDEELICQTLTVNRQNAVAEPMSTPEELQQILAPLAKPAKLEVEPPRGNLSGDPVLAMIGNAYRGRESDTKETMIELSGGTPETQEAVALGLKWLARNQQEDGSWNLKGPYANGGRHENHEVATAMALLAFQGDGNTTEAGPYQEEVRKGWYFLLRQQEANGCFYRTGYRTHRYYTQGLATIAVCELYGMTHSPALRRSYREPAIKAIEYCVKGQGMTGGWRYVSRTDSDLSVTGWVLMALQSARMAGLAVPRKTLYRASEFLDSTGRKVPGQYSYQPGKSPTRTMTAEGLLSRQYLGWKRDHPDLVAGVDWLLLPENELDYAKGRDVYYWYYATQVMHHMEGEPWKKWNLTVREKVPAAQVREGDEAGSWDPLQPSRDKRADEGGRLYVTCLSLYILEVYYRHLPLYSSPFVYLR